MNLNVLFFLSFSDLGAHTLSSGCFKASKTSLFCNLKAVLYIYIYIYILGKESSENHTVLSSFLFTIKIVINKVLALDYNGVDLDFSSSVIPFKARTKAAFGGYLTLHLD